MFATNTEKTFCVDSTFCCSPCFSLSPRFKESNITSTTSCTYRLRLCKSRSFHFEARAILIQLSHHTQWEFYVISADFLQKIDVSCALCLH